MPPTLVGSLCLVTAVVDADYSPLVNTVRYANRSASTTAVPRHVLP